MATQSNDGFADNWAYLKTELNWLDRMLMVALARYRQDKKGIDRVAQSQADRVSSHWWKGVVSLEGKVAYDEHRPGSAINNKKKKTNKATNSQPSQGYQKQLEHRIKVSQGNGVTLALPSLCDRLALSTFEKNLVLMGLAPEVNRRYARLYRYLQSQDEQPVTDLPTVELVLRLLCRNDQEWRRARSQLTPDSPLIRHNLLLLLYQPHQPFLNANIRLADELVDYLLSEKPDVNDLDQLLTATPHSSLTNEPAWPPSGILPVDFSNELSIDRPEPAALIEASGNANASSEEAIADTSDTSESSFTSASDSTGDGESEDTEEIIKAPTWDDLVIPTSLMRDLKHLGRRLKLHDTVAQEWALVSQSCGGIQPGILALFAGPSGTGKTLASRVVAHQIASPLYCVDLAGVMDIDYLQLIDELETTPQQTLLIQSAEHWLCRSSAMPPTRLTRFLAQRRKRGSLTIMSVQRVESITHHWHQYIDRTFEFSLPTPADRRKLWKRAFPHGLKLERKINWGALSQVPLSGGQIMAIAHDAMIRVAANDATTLTLDDLTEALRWHGVAPRRLQSVRRASTMARTRKATSKSTKSKSTKSKSTSTSKSSKSKQKSKSTPLAATKSNQNNTTTAAKSVKPAAKTKNPASVQPSTMPEPSVSTESSSTPSATS